MRKLFKLFTLTLVVCMAFTLVACGKDKHVGVYTPYEMKGTSMGETFSVSLGGLSEEEIEELDFFQANLYEVYSAMEIEVTKDEVIMSDGEDSERAKYRMDGNKVIALDEDGNEEPMSFDGISVEITIKGGVFTMKMTNEDDSVSIIFKKK